MTAADLTAFVPRIVPEWVNASPDALHRSLEGTLVFTDLSGFTAMSERLASLGKVGAEELTDHLDATFTELITVAGRLGGSLLKFGGDALLILFWDDDHAARAARAALDMQAAMARIGRIDTSTGEIQLQMTVGAHTGAIDLFLVGASHRELLVCGTAATETVQTESQAEPGEVRVSPALAAVLTQGTLDHPDDGPPRLVDLTDVEGRVGEVAAWPASTSAADFIPSMLREQLVQGVELTEHRQMAVGFIHLSNVDDRLGHDPGATSAELDDLLGHIQVVFAEHGVAFISSDVYDDGPKIICGTGAVRSFENDDERLLRALREVADLDSPIDRRIGAHRGHGFCGYVGPAFRRTFVTIGDVVNTSARVMAKAEPGDLLATGDVLNRSDTTFWLTSLPPFAAKGKAEPLIAHRVGAVTGDKEVGVDRRALPLIGREDALRRGLAVMETFQAGTGQLVEMVGDAGLGKSRLAAEMIISSPDVHTVDQRCGRYAASAPYFPFRGFLSDLYGADTEEGLRKLVADVAPHLEDDLSLVALPLGLRVDPSPTVAVLDPTARRNRLHGVTRELISLLLSEPTLWLIEDTHWIDEASAELLRALGPALATLPLLILVTRRPEGVGLGATTIDLDPLDAEAAELLAQRAADRLLLGPELERVVTAGNGNPHFLIELARAVSTADDLDTLPDSLEALLAARIDGLPARERMALRHLSVLGNRFDADVARQVVDLTGPMALDEFIEAGPTEWRFVQTLVRDTAYEGLSFRERRDVHGRAATVIERQAPDRAEVSELLSLHFSRAEQHPQALEYSNLAADRAEAGFAFAELTNLLKRSVAASRALEDDTALSAALNRIGRSSMDQGHWDDARTFYEESLPLKLTLREEQGVAAALNGLALISRAQGDYDRSLELFSQSRDTYRQLTETDPDDEENLQSLGAVLSNMGTLHLISGRHDEATTTLNDALAVQEGMDDRRGIARTLQMLATVALTTGDLTAAAEGFERAVGLAREAGDLPTVAGIKLSQGNLAIQRGRWDDARDALEESVTFYREAGDRQSVANVLTNLGALAQFRGEQSAAKGHYEESLELKREIGDRAGTARCLHNLGDLALAQGLREDAIPLCEEALAIRREIGDRQGTAHTLNTFALVAIDLQDTARATRFLVEAVDIATEIEDATRLGECLIAAAGLVSEPRASVELLACSMARLGAAGSTLTTAEQERVSMIFAQGKRALGDEAYAEAEERGAELTLDGAVELARRLLA